jgi:hypothetical protein
LPKLPDMVYRRVSGTWHMSYVPNLWGDDMKVKPIPLVTKDKSFIKCTNCGDVLISIHVHDFRACSCYSNEAGNKGCFIDGGDSYTRIGGSPELGYGKFEIDYNRGKFKLLEIIRESKQLT